MHRHHAQTSCTNIMHRHHAQTSCTDIMHKHHAQTSCTNIMHRHHAQTSCTNIMHRHHAQTSCTDIMHRHHAQTSCTNIMHRHHAQISCTDIMHRHHAHMSYTYIMQRQRIVSLAGANDQDTKSLNNNKPSEDDVSVGWFADPSVPFVQRCYPLRTASLLSFGHLPYRATAATDARVRLVDKEQKKVKRSRKEVIRIMR